MVNPNHHPILSTVAIICYCHLLYHLLANHFSIPITVTIGVTYHFSIVVTYHCHRHFLTADDPQNQPMEPQKSKGLDVRESPISPDLPGDLLRIAHLPWGQWDPPCGPSHRMITFNRENQGKTHDYPWKTHQPLHYYNQALVHH